MGDHGGGDGKDIHIPGPGDVNGDSILTKTVDFIAAHPVPVASVVLAIVATAFWKKNKILSVALLALGVGIVGTRMYLSMH